MYKTETEKNEAIALAIVSLLSLPVLLILIPIWCGFVLQVLWNWFPAVIFGVKQLTLWEAVGLYLLASWIVYTIHPQFKDDLTPKERLTKSWAGIFAIRIIWPLLLLGMGYIVKGLMA
jgi:hypothetical protein